ncbi:MAG TPA: calcineurin-like phosphoesterase C-terminal domain-containing protein [Luteimonas sp.]|nr:calcineurin-like phosphoesterase C-terminal domain-containing protein [Luteimonas sp.]HRO26274.1 calcineurin-like phosphoesterase C-terminal domain-containing protein [Luteimonas sp.]HRP71136.1 calcineurin-like phosphoesterase C-terminal domain-containing protein [Luteimonas sp.]
MPDWRRLRRVSLLCCALLPGAAWACGDGVVFEDGNGDGIRQPRERGLPGVRVSNGREIVSTDAAGAWRGLPADADGVAFVIKPTGFAVASGDGGLPAFWRTADDGGCEFALQRRDEAADGLKVIVSSDPQTGTTEEVAHYARIVESALVPHRDATLGLTLGDIANDDLALYPDINRATASLGVPWLHVPGNHDLDMDARDDHGSLATYRRVFGPDTYAWEEAGAAFVMLDNVIAQPGGRPAYVGGLRGDQFDFLERYLAALDRDRLLVVAAHIPWFDTAAAGRAPTIRAEDRERLFALLQPFPKVLLLSGHRHTQRHYFHGADSGWRGDTPLQEYNVGAMSGAYWSGVDDAAGIPVSTMADGTPRGFATLLVARDGSHRLAWHPTSRPAGDPASTDAMALHAPRLLRQGAYPAWGAYANVFMGHDGTRVEYRIDGGDWKPMAKVLAPDPRLLLENARDDLADALRGLDRSPEAEPSTHLWRGALDTKLAAGLHDVEVRTFDAAGGEHRARIGYRLDEWRE